MNLIGLFTAGACFGLWPLIMQKSGLQGIQQSLGLTLSTTAIILVAWFVGIAGGWAINTVLVFSLFAGIMVGFKLIEPSPYLIAVLAGLLNGLGTIKYLDSISSTQQNRVSAAILVVILTQIMINETGGIVMMGAEFSIRKAIGITMAICAIYLIVNK